MKKGNLIISKSKRPDGSKKLEKLEVTINSNGKTYFKKYEINSAGKESIVSNFHLLSWEQLTPDTTPFIFDVLKVFDRVLLHQHDVEAMERLWEGIDIIGEVVKP